MSLAIRSCNAFFELFEWMLVKTLFGVLSCLTVTVVHLTSIAHLLTLQSSGHRHMGFGTQKQVLSLSCIIGSFGFVTGVHAVSLATKRSHAHRPPRTNLRRTI